MAILTLALGIGATTAIFSVIYAVVINPYPYARPHEIWTPGVRSVKETQRMRPYPYDTFVQMQKLPAFSAVMATEPGAALLKGEYAPEVIGAIRVSGNAFGFLEGKTVIGRTIEPSDIGPDGEPEHVVVLSYKRWMRLFNGDPAAIGKKLRLNDEDYTIIGVMTDRFGWWTGDGVWLPMRRVPGDPQLVFPIVRLAGGATTAAAEQQLQPLFEEVAKVKYARMPTDEFKALLTNYMNITVASGEMRQSLQLLFGAVCFLLLIACANVANLQLAKATTRAREITIRLAVGARNLNIWKQLLTESVVLSATGGVLGLLFAYWITRLMVALMPSNFVPNESRIEVNTSVLVFCLIVSVATGILFGLVPAYQATRQNLADSLKDESRGSSGTHGGRLRALLVTAEVALAVVLLVSASLTIRSFRALMNVDLGYRPENALATSYSLPPKQYATLEKRNQFASELIEKIRATPGVVSATIGNGGLPFGGLESAYSIPGRAEPLTQWIRINAVTQDYLKTLGTALKQGRNFEAHEIASGNQVALINEAAAKLWPAGENAIGRQIKINELEKPSPPELILSSELKKTGVLTVIGIIANTRNDDIRADTRPVILIPYMSYAPPSRNIVIRAAGDPMALVPAIRTYAASIDPSQPLNPPITLERILGNRVAQPRFTMTLFTLFAAVGLALALAGIYSVLSYLVSMRTREIGVRMALGAGAADIRRLVLKTGARLVGAGVLVGIALSFVAARLLGSQMNLFKVSSTDPISFVVVILLIAAVAVAACLVPARQATKVDPMSALRFE